LGAADLDRGVAEVVACTGAQPARGGRHSRLGTHNALLSLGGKTYLEILAPDPSQERVVDALASLQHLETPRLVKWAIATNHLIECAAVLRSFGYPSEPIERGSRTQPDGRVLRWEQVGFLLTHPVEVPFAIRWADDSVHPADNAPRGCRLRELRIDHPDAGRLRELLGRLGVAIEVVSGREVKVRAALDTPRGPFEFTS
jgi:hypothetical protein